MIMAVLHYPALMPTLEELRADKEKSVPFFEKIPGLIHKTWGINEKTGRGSSVYHFEDQASADAWFNSDTSQRFRAENNASLEYFDVAVIASTRPLKRRT